MAASAIKCRAAVITPPGEGGISVVRLTGPNALALAQGIFRGKRPADLKQNIGKLHYGHLVKGEEVLDEVLLTVLDDGALEINCHGGIVAVERVMAELERRGAKRVHTDVAAADRLDAVQHEAAAAIPRAQSRPAVKMLLEQYHGRLSRAVESIAQMPPHEAATALAGIKATARLGMALCTPKRIVIVGSPNAGKSTLFNTLLGHSRAIVTHIPGTTRDFISDTVVLDGIPFELVDTAGLRDTDHVIEREGVRVSRQQISAADVVLFIFDASGPSNPQDDRIFAQLRSAVAPVLVAANKIDLLHQPYPPQPIAPDVWISAETGAGIGDLEARIVRAAVGDATYTGGPAVFTQRQLALIAQSLEAAQRRDRGFVKLLHAVTRPTRE